MPGSISVNERETFGTILLMSAAPKLKFGTDQPDISANGEKKWTAEVAVTYHTEPGMRPVSEVLSVTVTGPDNVTINPGTPVEFDRLRCGVSTPELRDRDRGRIAGGRLFWMASGIRPASGMPGRPLVGAGKSEG